MDMVVRGDDKEARPSCKLPVTSSDVLTIVPVSGLPESRAWTEPICHANVG
jgi:hypothetical protein